MTALHLIDSLDIVHDINVYWQLSTINKYFPNKINMIQLDHGQFIKLRYSLFLQFLIAEQRPVPMLSSSETGLIW